MTANFPSQGRIAGIDFGTVRIGIAVTDPSRTLASPYENYTRRGTAADARRFQQLVAEERIVGFVVGLPVHTDGNESQKSWEARQFGEWLTAQTGVPVTYFDERYTSVEAEHLLADAQFTSKRRKSRRDMLAAQLLLASFLESTGRDEPPRALDDGRRGGA
jgi:putative holliday junction resolvase